MKEVRGPLKVKGTPLDNDAILTQIGAMRMTFEKSFEGALDATGVVSMMGLMNQEKKAGSYVALEKITGSLEGRKGSFCLSHSSWTNNGVSNQSILVVPHSGTEQLEGLKGSMVIDIKDGTHSYIFSYEFES